jgi:hypothetical protein
MRAFTMSRLRIGSIAEKPMSFCVFETTRIFEAVMKKKYIIAMKYGTAESEATRRTAARDKTAGGQSTEILCITALS